jgi:hypothetical protein
LLPNPVNKHIDGVVGLLNDGITSHSGESGIRFLLELSSDRVISLNPDGSDR